MMYSINQKQDLQSASGIKIHYVLRIASAMCFIGHGSFGIITKSIWANYFGVFGIGYNESFRLMPVVGSIDILFGLIILFYPVRAVIMWLVIWGFITALLRPLSGEPFPEFIERAGNFGAPLALLVLSGGISFKNLFSPLKPVAKLSPDAVASLRIALRIIVFFLLAGHGWLNLIEKKGIVNQYASLGFASPVEIARLVGCFEILAALSVLLRPVRSFVLFLFIWKITTELFYPHYEIFEWIERGGSYGSILALWFALQPMPSSMRNKELYKRVGVNFFSSKPKIFFK